MTDLESRFHAEWLGLVQPVEGLVVSVPVLTDAQCMRRQPLAKHQRFAELTSPPAAARPLSLKGEGALHVGDESPFVDHGNSPSPFRVHLGTHLRNCHVFPMTSRN